MFIDDLSFDGLEPGVSGDPGAEAAARAVKQWNELERQRHAQEVGMKDARTERLTKLLHLTKSLTRINGEINNLILSAENDEGSLIMLQNQLANAEQRAAHIYHEYEKRLGVA